MLNFPKDTPRSPWTRHIKNKMVFYHLSGAQIMRIFRKPDRREEGIAPDTIAAMKSKGKGVGGRVQGIGKTEEIWIMYKTNKGLRTKDGEQKSGSAILSSQFSVLRPRASRVTMISTWRYPGVTKPGERPKIPEDALAEIDRF